MVLKDICENSTRCSLCIISHKCGTISCRNHWTIQTEYVYGVRITSFFFGNNKLNNNKQLQALPYLYMTTTFYFCISVTIFFCSFLSTYTANSILFKMSILFEYPERKIVKFYRLLKTSFHLIRVWYEKTTTQVYN